MEGITCKSPNAKEESTHDTNIAHLQNQDILHNKAVQENPQVFIPRNVTYKQINKPITSESTGNMMYSLDEGKMIQINYTGKINYDLFKSILTRSEIVSCHAWIIRRPKN